MTYRITWRALLLVSDCSIVVLSAVFDRAQLGIEIAVFVFRRTPNLITSLFLIIIGFDQSRPVPGNKGVCGITIRLKNNILNVITLNQAFGNLKISFFFLHACDVDGYVVAIAKGIVSYRTIRNI